MADYSDYKECTDCAHYELCLYQEKFLIEHNRKDLIRRYGFGLCEPENCCHFQDRSRFVELPCKIGTELFRIKQINGKRFITNTALNSNTFWNIVIQGAFGKTVFLTREEAEQALKECETDG